MIISLLTLYLLHQENLQQQNNNNYYHRPSNSHNVVVRLTISGLISRSHDLTSKSHGFPQ